MASSIQDIVATEVGVVVPVVPKAKARRYFEVVHKTVLRAGAAMDSEKVGILPSGSILPALEVQKGAKGKTARVHLGAGQNEDGEWPTGWVSMVSSKGNKMLVEVERWNKKKEKDTWELKAGKVRA